MLVVMICKNYKKINSKKEKSIYFVNITSNSENHNTFVTQHLNLDMYEQQISMHYNKKNRIYTML